MLSPACNLSRFFETLRDKTWIEILTATQDEIRRLSVRPPLSKLDAPTAYLSSLKEFEAYLFNPTDPLPEEYKTLVRNMRIIQEPGSTRETAKAKKASA